MKEVLMIVLSIALIAAFFLSLVLMFVCFVAATGVFAIGATDPSNAYRFNGLYILFIPVIIAVDVFIWIGIVKLLKAVIRKKV